MAFFNKLLAAPYGCKIVSHGAIIRVRRGLRD